MRTLEDEWTPSNESCSASISCAPLVEKDYQQEDKNERGCSGKAENRLRLLPFPFYPPVLMNMETSSAAKNRSRNAPAHVTHGIPGLNGIATAVMANYTIALYTWFDVESLSIGRRPFQLAGNHGDHCASCSIAG